MKIADIEKLNKTDKPEGLKVFLSLLEIDFVKNLVPATRTGAGISYGLSGWGGMYTPGYTLAITTHKGRKYRVVENNKCIENGIMREFYASGIYKKAMSNQYWENYNK